MMRSSGGRAGCASMLLLAAIAAGCGGDEPVGDLTQAVVLVDPTTLTPPLLLEDTRCQRVGAQIRCTADVEGPLFGFLASCGFFGAFLEGTDEARVTAWYDAGGVLTSVTEHHQQRGTVSNLMGGTTQLDFRASFTISADVVQVHPMGVELGPITYTGQVVNVTDPASGVVLHDVGKIVLGAGLVFQGGPHDVFEGNTGELCAALCDAPLATCAGSCTMTDWDPAHCGACGNACGAGQQCQLGACVDDPCAADGACNQQQCGLGDPDCFAQCQIADQVCNVECGPADPDCQTCFAPGPDGVCLPGCEQFGTDPDCPCVPGSVRCAEGQVCAFLEWDPANCGACGNVCDPGDFCSGGTCVDGQACGGDGVCEPACPPGADPDCRPGACMSDADCPAGMFCEPGMMICVPAP